MKTMFFTGLVIFVTSLNTVAQKFDDVTLPALLNAGKEKIVYNGGGIREKYFMDMYIGGLYLLQKNKDAQKVVKADETMGIKIHIVSSLISSEKMINAVNEGFENSVKDGYVAASDKIKTFAGCFSEIHVGDEFDLIYTPAEGTMIYRNNQLKATIKGLDFKKALFDIWLGTYPADGDLKTGMLGG